MLKAKQNRSLIIIIIFLLLTNAALVFFFLVSKPGQRRSHQRDENGIYNVLQKDVGFSKDQLGSYMKLRTIQQQKVKDLFSGLRTAKENFYARLYQSPVEDSVQMIYANIIAQKQKELDMQMFTHFEKVRGLCTPSQLPQFDSTIKKIIMRMSGPGKGHRDNK